MSKKNASIQIQKFTRAVVAAILHAFLFGAFPGAYKSQEKPEFDKPFKICRIYANKNGAAQTIASDNNKNFIYSNENDFLVSINLEMNLENWRTQTGGKLYPTIISDTENLYYLTSVENETRERTFVINALSQKTGINKWQKKLEGVKEIRLFGNFNEKFLYLTDGSQNILAIGKNDGNINWTKNIRSRIIAIDTLQTEQLGILTEESVIKISSSNGETLSEKKIKKNPISNSIKNNSYVLLGYANGEFLKFSIQNGLRDVIWKIKAGGSISSVIELRDEALVSSLDNFLYLYTTNSGKLKWKRRVSGRINIKPLIYENFALVLSSSDNIASIIELEGGKIVNQIKIEDGNYFSGEPFVLGKSIIFPTYRGIYKFNNSNLECR